MSASELAPMSDDLKKEVCALQADKKFQNYLQWLMESRERLHQKMYTTLAPAEVAFLQGAAKMIFDAVTDTHKALEIKQGPAILADPETPYGDV